MTGSEKRLVFKEVLQNARGLQNSAGAGPHLEGVEEITNHDRKGSTDFFVSTFSNTARGHSGRMNGGDEEKEQIGFGM